MTLFTTYNLKFIIKSFFINNYCVYKTSYSMIIINIVKVKRNPMPANSLTFS